MTSTIFSKTKKVKASPPKPDRLYSIASIRYVYHMSLKVSASDRDSMTVGELKALQKKLEELRFRPIMTKHITDNIANPKVKVFIN